MAELPVVTLEHLARNYDYDEIVVIARRYDKEKPTENPSHIQTVTYGKTKYGCNMAAQAGNYFKRVISQWLHHTKVAETAEIKSLELKFPYGETSSFCDKVARYVDRESSYSCSGGGFEMTRMPMTKEEEKEFGPEFSEDKMVYSYDYKK